MDDAARWMHDDGPKFWLDLRTGEIAEGRVSPAAHRMGPYPTREAAQHAFDTAAQRNESWDEEDKRWDEEDKRWKDDDWGSDGGA